MSRAVFARASAVVSTTALVCAAVAAWSAPDRRRHATVGAQVEPLVFLAGSPAGGVVRDVYRQPGASVEAGQLLVRFDTAALQKERRELAAILASAKSGFARRRAAAALPPQLTSRLLDAHPDVVAAEGEYINALEAWQNAAKRKRATAAQRLDRAAEARAAVRLRIGKMLSTEPPLAPAAMQLAGKTLEQLDALIESASVRAPGAATVDILDVKPGDRIPAGHPVALLLLSGEYFSDIALPANSAGSLRQGMTLHAFSQQPPRETIWRVDAVSKRDVPAAFRDEGRGREETVVRARLSSPQKIPSGTILDFQLP